MTSRRALALSFALALAAAPAAAQTSYTFDVHYFGGGVSSLAPGSDPTAGTVLLAGDDFFWRIAAQNGDVWRVNVTTGYFPLMAFGVNETGMRTGDWTLRLFRGLNEVFTFSETGSEQLYVHVGTNTVNLAAGLTFDRMELAYLLTDAVAEGTGDPIGTTILRNLPIFGAPEQNIFSPGITYGAPSVVPEPATGLLVLTGAGVLGLVARRRRGVAQG